LGFMREARECGSLPLCCSAHEAEAAGCEVRVGRQIVKQRLSHLSMFISMLITNLTPITLDKQWLASLFLLSFSSSAHGFSRS